MEVAKLQTKTIFLASSAELVADRREFELQVGRRNKDWVPKGVHLRLELWEDFLDGMTPDGLQRAYNRVIEQCDLFVMLFWTKVGQYTRAEFETAFKQFQATHKPFILTYFKDAPISTGAANRDDLQSLWAFQDKLKALGHYQTRYSSTEELLLHFSQQLDKLVANGFIEFEPADAEPAGATYHATLRGSGAIAQGSGAIAVGKGGVHIGGSNTGNINTGTQMRIDTGGGAYVGGDVRVTGGDFVGRDKISRGGSHNELAAQFASLLKAVKEQASPAVQPQAVARVAELEAEVQEGKADDGKVAGIIEGLTGLVPSAIGSVVQMFASPILQGLIGPVTKYVLGKLQ